MKKHRSNFICGVCCGGVVTLYLLLFAEPTSPVINKLNGLLAFGPYYLVTHIVHDVHAAWNTVVVFYEILVFLQWFAVGFFLSWIFNKFRSHDDAA